MSFATKHFEIEFQCWKSVDLENVTKKIFYQDENVKGVSVSHRLKLKKLKFYFIMLF